MDKSAFRQALLAELESELHDIEKAAASAHEGATHQEAIAEDKYDTRGLEQSYLAGAQDARVKELRAIVAVYRSVPVREFDEDDEIGAFAMVRLEDESGGQRTYYLGPQGGGVRVPFEGVEILVITPRAPLGESLMGKCAGDEVTVPTPEGPRVYAVVGVS